MGKIRVKSFDEEEQKKQEERRKAKKESRSKSKAPGLKGGERIVTVGPSLDEIESFPTSQAQETQGEKVSKKKKKFIKKKTKSNRYIANASLIKTDDLYNISKAIELLKKLKKAKFDETVELHINTKEKGLAYQLTLPHGTGKKIRVTVADQEHVDKIVSDIEKGQLDFDVLVAIPTVMQKLAKVARILGPKGLMPNPKNGTISDKPQDVVEKLSKGQISFKTEAQSPVIHLAVGKLSFDEEKLEENIRTVIKTIGDSKINAVTLKSSMSPGIKLKIV